MDKKNEFGLVFSSGGGKGSYEIGVWKALQESEVFHISAVSGSSVGALNAALYATMSYEEAEKIWKSIQKDEILTEGLTKSTLSDKGLFSKEGLRKIIRQSGVAEALPKTELPCYAACYNMTKRKVEYFKLNDRNSDEIVDILLASSSIPVIFPRENVGDDSYCDGGTILLGERMPVTPLYQMGCRRFIVVHLDKVKISSFAYKFKDATFLHVFPSKSLGGPIEGVLDFNPENVEKRIQQGYDDMKQQMVLF